jgi:hypothetical protein
MTTIQNDVKRGKTGKGYKITSFSEEYARKNNHGRYYLALFNKDELQSHEGWYCDNLRHAKEDGEGFIKAEPSEDETPYQPLSPERSNQMKQINKIMDELHVAKIKISIDEEPDTHITQALDMLETLSMEM